MCFIKHSHPKNILFASRAWSRQVILCSALIVFFIFLPSCKKHDSNDRFKAIRETTLLLPSGHLIRTSLAITEEEQRQGLSGIQPDQFSDERGLLFFYLEDGQRRFWMFDTYFPLDIIFLDATFNVIAVEKNVPFYPSKKFSSDIPATKIIWARHVLEIKAGTPLSEEIKTGVRLQITGGISLSQIEQEIRRQ